MLSRAAASAACASSPPPPRPRELTEGFHHRFLADRPARGRQPHRGVSPAQLLALGRGVPAPCSLVRRAALVGRRGINLVVERRALPGAFLGPETVGAGRCHVAPTARDPAENCALIDVDAAIGLEHEPIWAAPAAGAFARALLRRCVTG